VRRKQTEEICMWVLMVAVCVFIFVISAVCRHIEIHWK
jgi:hypothetical protein